MLDLSYPTRSLLSLFIFQYGWGPPFFGMTLIWRMIFLVNWRYTYAQSIGRATSSCGSDEGYEVYSAFCQIHSPRWKLKAAIICQLNSPIFSSRVTRLFVLKIISMQFQHRSQFLMSSRSREAHEDLPVPHTNAEIKIIPDFLENILEITRNSLEYVSH